MTRQPRPALGLIVAAALAAAGVPHAAAQTRSDLVIGTALEPTGLDPTIAAPAAIREATLYNLFEGLVRLDPDGRTIRPLLAESWIAAADGLSYVFKLRQGVRFHDGTGFDAADVRFAFERAMAPGSTNAQKHIFAPIAAIETPTPYDVRLRLSRPAPNLLFQLTWGDAVIVAPETAAGNAATPVGTGPFRFSEWRRGDRLELVRFADYWDKERTKLEKVTIRFISDPQAQAAALRAGDVDAFPNLGAPELFERLKADPRLVGVAGQTEGEIILALNNARPPFDKVGVRRALAHAIDRKGLVAAAYSGIGTPIGSHFSPNHPAYMDLTGLYPYDPAKAKALLAEAGLAGGFSATLRLPPPAYARRSGEVVAAMLGEVGIKVAIEPIEFGAWIQQVFSKSEFDMTIIAHTEPLDIGIYGREKYYFNYANSGQLRGLLEQIDAELDAAKRAALYGAAQRLIAADAPNVFLFQLPKLGVWRRDLDGLWPNAPIQANDLTEVRWR